MIVASEEGMAAFRDRASRPGGLSVHEPDVAARGGRPGKEADRGGIAGRGEGAGGQGERFALLFSRAAILLSCLLKMCPAFFVILVHTQPQAARCKRVSGGCVRSGEDQARQEDEGRNPREEEGKEHN